MLKKSITFENFDGTTVTEDHYFHLSKADLVELEMSKKGGLQDYIQRIIDSNDGKAILEEFKKLIMLSYGKKSPDGSRFIKSQELRDDFLASPAYDEFFMELVTDAGKAAEFMNGIIPKGMDQIQAKVPKPARTINEVIEAERIKENGLDEPKENVFANNVPVPDDPSTLHNEGSEPSTDLIGTTPEEPRLLTRKEALEMPGEELQRGLAAGEFRLN